MSRPSVTAALEASSATTPAARLVIQKTWLGSMAQDCDVVTGSDEWPVEDDDVEPESDDDAAPDEDAEPESDDDAALAPDDVVDAVWVVAHRAGRRDHAPRARTSRASRRGPAGGSSRSPRALGQPPARSS